MLWGNKGLANVDKVSCIQGVYGGGRTCVDGEDDNYGKGSEEEEITASSDFQHV